MSTARDYPSSSLTTGRTPELVWRCWPLCDRAPGSWLVVLLLLLVGLAVAAITGRAALGVLAAAALALALWRVFLPVRYEIGPAGVCHVILRRRSLLRWSEVGRVELRPDGVLLFDRKSSGPFDALRAVYLPCATHRDVVLRLVEKYFR